MRFGAGRVGGGVRYGIVICNIHHQSLLGEISMLNLSNILEELTEEQMDRVLEFKAGGGHGCGTSHKSKSKKSKSCHKSKSHKSCSWKSGCN
jgi:hypothetical protein